MQVFRSLLSYHFGSRTLEDDFGLTACVLWIGQLLCTHHLRKVPVTAESAGATVTTTFLVAPCNLP